MGLLTYDTVVGVDNRCFIASEAMTLMSLANFGDAVLPQQGPEFEQLVFDIEARGASFDGYDVLQLPLTLPFPAPKTEAQSAVVTKDAIRILDHLRGNGRRAVVLLNGPLAEGPDVVVLRKSDVAPFAEVHMCGCKNRKEGDAWQQKLRKLGADNRAVTSQSKVLHFFCGLLEQVVAETLPAKDKTAKDDQQNMTGAAHFTKCEASGSTNRSVDVKFVLYETVNMPEPFDIDGWKRDGGRTDKLPVATLIPEREARFGSETMFIVYREGLGPWGRFVAATDENFWEFDNI